MPYVVYADPPTSRGRLDWDFRDGFFPRTVHYKKDAEKLKAEAESKGGRNVRVKPKTRR